MNSTNVILVRKSTTVLSPSSGEKERYTATPLAFALIYCGLDDKDQPITYLEKARQGHAGGLLAINVGQLWASLRTEPAFTQLVSAMGLSPTEKIA